MTLTQQQLAELMEEAEFRSEKLNDPTQVSEQILRYIDKASNVCTLNPNTIERIFLATWLYMDMLKDGLLPSNMPPLTRLP